LLPDINISQGSVATHLRCDGIFIDNIMTNFLLIQTETENRLKIGQYLMRLWGVQKCAIFWATLYNQSRKSRTGWLYILLPTC